MTSRLARRAPQGFTLIELMIVVAIIGLLASVAMPEFARARYRAQAAERVQMMEAISRAAGDVVARFQAIPGPPGSLVWGALPNPAGAPTSVKRYFNQGFDNWPMVPLAVEGGCYYSYSFTVTDVDGNGGVTAMMRVQADGDLDGDSVVSRKIIDHQADAFVFRKLDPETPPAGQEDLDTF